MINYIGHHSLDTHSSTQKTWKCPKTRSNIFLRYGMYVLLHHDVTSTIFQYLAESPRVILRMVSYIVPVFMRYFVPHRHTCGISLTITCQLCSWILKDDNTIRRVRLGKSNHMTKQSELLCRITDRTQDPIYSNPKFYEGS